MKERSTTLRPLVGDRVEPGRAPAPGASALAGSDLVPLLRDHARDPAPGEVSAVGSRGVGAIGEDRGYGDEVRHMISVDDFNRMIGLGDVEAADRRYSLD